MMSTELGKKLIKKESNMTKRTDWEKSDYILAYHNLDNLAKEYFIKHPNTPKIMLTVDELLDLAFMQYASKFSDELKGETKESK